MPDREKVIKDLEKIHTHFWVKYRGCGIKAEKAKYKERLSAVADAITLLKEQYETIKELQSAYDYLQKQFFDAQDKLLKEQEPQVLTLDELTSITDECWFDGANGACGYAFFYDINKESEWAELQRIAMQNEYVRIDEYGKKWRCWTYKPTKEQRKAVKWDD